MRSKKLIIGTFKDEYRKYKLAEQSVYINFAFFLSEQVISDISSFIFGIFTFIKIQDGTD